MVLGLRGEKLINLKQPIKQDNELTKKAKLRKPERHFKKSGISPAQLF